jgi:uncharacterized membrane protein
MTIATSNAAPIASRALRSFLRDRVSQVALGVFVATFAYSLAALSAVRVAAGDDPGFVPGITVTGALALVAASVVMFVRLIDHTAHSLRRNTTVSHDGAVGALLRPRAELKAP